MIFIDNKNNKFLSLKFNLNLIFLINNKVKIINGINIPICFPKNINGNLIWSIKLDCSKPVRASP